MISAIYTGTLMHSRRTPTRNTFRYPISYFLLDLDELTALERRLALFSVNRPNVLTLHDRDHFDGGPLKRSVVDFVGDPGIERVLMLAQLRVLGYVFNPVTFYWCYGRASTAADGSTASRPEALPGRAGRTVPSGLPPRAERRETADGLELRCMVAELSNTFGERLPEVLHGPSLRYEHRKRLHVSPFFGLDQSYEYAFSQPGDEVWARIHVRENGGRPLTAVLHGRRQELTNRNVARLLVRYPLMPMQVTALIHWQALRLWLKGVPFHRKPAFVPGEGSAR